MRFSIDIIIAFGRNQFVANPIVFDDIEERGLSILDANANVLEIGDRPLTIDVLGSSRHFADKLIGIEVSGSESGISLVEVNERLFDEYTGGGLRINLNDGGDRFFVDLKIDANQKLGIRRTV